MTNIYEAAMKLYSHTYSTHENKWSLCKPIGLPYRSAINLEPGLAGENETSLYAHLKEMHYDEQAILNSGLCSVQPDGSVKDTIRNSLVFPRYDMQDRLSAILTYDLSAARWTQISIPGCAAFLGCSLDKRAGFLILCETPEQTLRLWANGILNAVAGSTAELSDTPKNAEFFKSVNGPVILFPKSKDAAAWAQRAGAVLEKYNIPVFHAQDYLTDEQLSAIENMNDEEMGNYLAIGSVFLRCDPAAKQIDIPEGVEIISRVAFTGCDDIEKIVIPNGVRKLDVKLFGADMLKQLHIPASVTEINPFILNRGAKCTVHTTKGSAAENFARMNRLKLVIKVRTK